LRQQCRSDPQNGQVSRLPTGVSIFRTFRHAWHLFIFPLPLIQEKIHPTVGSDFWQVSALSFDNSVKNEQKDRPANRQQQADGIETRNGPKPQIGSYKTAYERSPYPDQNRQDKPAGVLSRHDEFGQRAYDQTHNDPR
jgi:hypothetical protein